MPWRDAPVVAEAQPGPHSDRMRLAPPAAADRQSQIMGARAPEAAPLEGETLTTGPTDGSGWQDAPVSQSGDEAGSGRSWGDAIRGRLATERDATIAMVRGASQGATMGWWDEIGSGLIATAKAPFSGRGWREIYDEELGRERSAVEAGREQYPVAAYGGEIAGAGFSGAGLMRQAAAHLPRLSFGQRLTATGGTEGAAYGAGASEEGERATGAAIGGTIGTVLPVPLQRTLSAAGTAAGSAVRSFTDTPERKAQRLVGQALERDRLTPAEAVRQITDMGPQTRLADMGENLGGLARAVTARPGPARTTARDFLEERQAGQAQRLMRQAGLDDVPQFRRSFQKFMTQRHSAAKPLYEQAYATQLDLSSPQMQALVQRPSMQRALREAQTILKDEGGGTGHVRLMDAAKRHLDDRIGSALRTGERDTARRLINLRRELLEEVDRQVPAFAQARATYAGEASMRDAAQLGRNLFGRRLDLDDAELLIARMGDGERQAFQRGALRGLVDTLENMASTHDAGRKLIASPRQREVMRLAFQDEGAVQRLIQAAETESTYSATRNVVRGGSPTARIQEEVAGLDQTAGIGAALRQGNVIGATSRMLRALGIGKPSDETLEAVGRILFTPDAAGASRALPQPRAAVVNPDAAGGALVGAGAAAVQAL